jgi:rhodanese-related sulfurtransferase
VLGVFSGSNRENLHLSTEGIYEVPRDGFQTGLLCPPKGNAETEKVEVRRSSVVMSSSMMMGILGSGQRAHNGHIEDRLAGTQEDDEVVLPFFCPVKGRNEERKQCRCKVDPMTGIVIHTCMTPNLTQATNTEALNSYVCSAWNSTLGTKAASSRRASEGERYGEEDGEEKARKKRIRNASTLLMVGGKGPTPGSAAPDDDEEEQDERTAENELAVSFCAIQSSQLDSQLDSRRGSQAGSTAGSETPMCEGSTPMGRLGQENGGEQEVEAALGHRFDFVEPRALGVMLHDSEVREHLLVVDVRGRDWVGGHIPSSINLRTLEVLNHPQSLLAQCRQNRIHKVIFTCMYSVLRARKCAAALERAQAEEQKAGMHAPYRIKIYLLRGGMHAWVNHYVEPSGTVLKGNEFLLNFEPDMWSDGGPSQGGLVHVMDALWSSGGQKALSDALTQELKSLQAKLDIPSAETSRRSSNNDCV